MAGGKNKLFKKDPVEFMKRYAVVPCDDVGKYIGDKGVTMDTRGAVGEDYFFSTVEPNKKVAWLNFSKKPRGGGLNYFVHNAEGAIMVDGTYTARPHKIPAYFLPWSAGGAIINLTIPDKATLRPGDLDSDFFFTAAITGCSIFVKGNPNNPTVYHAGGDTKQSDPANGAAFWVNLMNLHSGAAPLAATVDKRDYVSDPLANLAGKTTRNAEIFETWLKGNSPADLDIQATHPYGCVMGVRDSTGNWAFYVQENATILYFKMEKKHFYSKTRQRVGQMRAAGRTMIFREFYPNGTGHQVFAPQLPRKI